MSRIDFDDRIEALFEGPVTTKDNLSIWGGEFKAGRTDDFLKKWKLEQRDMPWRVWEWISQITFQWKTEPDNSEMLERGRLFGPGGDLSLRRDGERFLWCFIGPRQEALPDGFEWDEGKNDEPETEKLFLVADYWCRQPTGWELQSRDRTVLLWGQEHREQNENPLRTWHDDRVGGVREPIEYPTMSGRDKEGRVKLCYREYLRGGDMEVVWWLGLKGLNEACEEESYE